MFCSACGTEVEEHARYCWKCGAPITQAPRRGKADAAKADGDDGAHAADGQGSASEAVKGAPDRTISHGGANITVGRDGTIHVENKAADAKGDAAREERAPLPAEAAPAPDADAGRDATPAEAAPEASPAPEPKDEPPTFTATRSTGSIGGFPLKGRAKTALLGLLAFVALVAVVAVASSVFSRQNDGITSSIDDAAEEDAAQSQTPSSEAYTYPVVGSGVDDAVLQPTFYDGTFGEVLERLEDHGFDLNFVHNLMRCLS